MQVIASDFCVLILFPVTVLNSVISSSNLLIVSLGFCMYYISCYLQTVRALLFLDSFYFFIFSAVARTSKTMLNNNGESVLFLILGGMFSVFHH